MLFSETKLFDDLRVATTADEQTNSSIKRSGYPDLRQISKHAVVHGAPRNRRWSQEKQLGLQIHANTPVMIAAC